jgi:hypothetical protein
VIELSLPSGIVLHRSEGSFMRLASWMFTSLIFTLAWWLVAPALIVAHAPLAYFGVGVLSIVGLAWAFGLLTRAATLGRTVMVSTLSMVVLATAFLVVAFVAGSAQPNSQSSLTAMKQQHPAGRLSSAASIRSRLRSF